MFLQFKSPGYISQAELCYELVDKKAQLPSAWLCRIQIASRGGTHKQYRRTFGMQNCEEPDHCCLGKFLLVTIAIFSRIESKLNYIFLSSTRLRFGKILIVMHLLTIAQKIPLRLLKISYELPHEVIGIIQHCVCTCHYTLFYPSSSPLPPLFPLPQFYWPLSLSK